MKGQRGAIRIDFLKIREVPVTDIIVREGKERGTTLAIRIKKSPMIKMYL